MRISLFVIVLVAGCGGAPEPTAPQDVRPPSDESRGAAPVATPPPLRDADARWALQSSGEGTALVVAGASGDTVMRLFCAAGTGGLQVNVPGFDPIGSEERLSFGHDSTVAALVADTAGDAARGGVTGAGPVPRDLARLLAGPVSASYGVQTSGPHAAPGPELVASFVAACLDVASPAAAPKPAPDSATRTADTPPAGSTSTPAPVSACRVQDAGPVPANALRAVGTEPFWGAHVDGRCVTYTHPENPAGTRVWTRFAGTAVDGTWTGALQGAPFVMRTRAAPCSDGMSDTRYPITVTLTVGGGQRSGCAAPR